MQYKYEQSYSWRISDLKKIKREAIGNSFVKDILTNEGVTLKVNTQNEYEVVGILEPQENRNDLHGNKRLDI